MSPIGHNLGTEDSLEDHLSWRKEVSKGLVKTPEVKEPERQERHDDPIELGQWYWVQEGEQDQWLGCIVELGSNYAELHGPVLNRSQTCTRVHFDEWDETVTRAVDPEHHIQAKINQHREEAERLMGEVKQLTARLGLVPAGQLTDGTSEASTALVAVHGAKDVKAHKRALIKAKEKTLPELFKKIEAENAAMAGWMKAGLLPLEAQQGALKRSTESIEDRIFTVELYAGLCENVECIREGEPAGNDQRIHLFQRRHYMDEESLLDYRAGGMDFHGIRDFDRWLTKRRNLNRLLPMPRCVVAFRVRRNSKEREVVQLWDFIKFQEFERQDKTTYLYIRNGDQVWRLVTEIKFGRQLFPDAEHARLLAGGQLWIKHSFGHEPITEAEYQDIVAREQEAKEKYERELAEWNKIPANDPHKPMKPWYHESYDRYEPLTPASVYYDDAMAKVAEQMRHHNQIATVLQGILDRSPVFQPHPPWRLWTPEGFSAGIELHYDDSRALVDGDPLEFERYRNELNKSIRRGTNTTGQQEAWERHEAKKENERQERDYRIRHRSNYKRYAPYGNPGPGVVAEVAAINRSGTLCSFEWWRERLRYQRWRDDQDVRARFRCHRDLLLNVDQYTPGDYRQFYQDPRTRAKYLVWAPLMLAAEDWHAGKTK